MFWDIERHQPGGWFYDSISSRQYSYEELGDLILTWEKHFGSGNKILVGLVVDNSCACIACYLAALRCGHAVMFLNASGDQGLRESVLREYKPEFLALSVDSPLPKEYACCWSHNDFVLAEIKRSCGMSIHPDTAVLLSTSGTTGSPKFVRLSSVNIQSNAESISSYLQISGEETAISSLSFSYSYGFSVLNSHLHAGANLVCTDASIVTSEFWRLFRGYNCTSFAGVPYSYLMLERLRFNRMDLPSLRTMTQAGGRLAVDKLKYFSDEAARRNGRFFVMYGQTEASPRIAYVPWGRLKEKMNSAGIPIPGGRIRIVVDGMSRPEPLSEGEVVYEGPNVMMGYAESRRDLSKDDEMGGVLPTGDVGYLDQEGYLFITGRLKRFIKLFGLRINLDDVERMLEAFFSFPVACVGRDEQLFILLETPRHELMQVSRERISSIYRVHQSAVKALCTSSLPVTAAGKKDYPTIEREIMSHEHS